jgi:hypothetical protein
MSPTQDRQRDGEPFIMWIRTSKGKSDRLPGDMFNAGARLSNSLIILLYCISTFGPQHAQFQVDASCDADRAVRLS